MLVKIIYIIYSKLLKKNSSCPYFLFHIDETNFGKIFQIKNSILNSTTSLYYFIGKKQTITNTLTTKKQNKFIK